MYFTKLELRKALEAMIIDFIMCVKAKHSTMQVVPQPSKWFTLQDHVTDSQASRFLCRVGAGSAVWVAGTEMYMVPNLQAVLPVSSQGSVPNSEN